MGSSEQEVHSEYHEDRTLCGIPYKLLAIITAIYGIVNFVYEFAYLIAICLNPYFDDYFYVWYAIVLLPLAGAAAVLAVFVLRPESAKSRRFIPHACVAAGASSFLVVFWIALYIAAVYPYNKVFASQLDRALELQLGDVDDAYVEQDKTFYILSRTW